MTEDALKPVMMLSLGLAVVGFMEYIFSGTRTLYVQAYELGLVVVGCSPFFFLANLGSRRFHNLVGVVGSLTGFAIASVATYIVAARFLSLVS